MTFGLLTMISCFFGQISAILGQFGYQYSKPMSFVYTSMAFSIVLVSVLFGKVLENFLLETSLIMTTISAIISLLVAIKQ